jgi:hypothetical protein
MYYDSLDNHMWPRASARSVAVNSGMSLQLELLPQGLP